MASNITATATMGYAFQASAGISKDFADIEMMMPRLTKEVPNVARMAPLIVECAWDDEYMFGPDIILDGLQARLS